MIERRMILKQAHKKHKLNAMVLYNRMFMWPRSLTLRQNETAFTLLYFDTDDTNPHELVLYFSSWAIVQFKPAAERVIVSYLFCLVS